MPTRCPSLPAYGLAALAVTCTWLAGCSPAQGRAIETAAVHLGELACEVLVPIAVPGLAPEAVLGCAALASEIAAAIGTAAATAPPPVVGQSMVSRGNWPVKGRDGRVVAVVRGDEGMAQRASRAMAAGGGR